MKKFVPFGDELVIQKVVDDAYHLYYNDYNDHNSDYTLIRTMNRKILISPDE